MKAQDMIFEEVYKGALAKGAVERSAKDCAVQAIQDFKRSNYKSIKHLIDNAIRVATK